MNFGVMEVVLIALILAIVLLPHIELPDIKRLAPWEWEVWLLLLATAAAVQIALATR